MAVVALGDRADVVNVLAPAAPEVAADEELEHDPSLNS
jgi:hypothetical protein